MKIAGLLFAMAGLLAAQEPNPAQRNISTDNGVPQPIYRVTVVSRTTAAINYHHRQGSTNVDFHGTALLPEGRGTAKVESNTGATKLQCHFDHLKPATTVGPEYLTYVLWAITPEGRAKNLGEIVMKGGGADASIDSTTDLQAFGMIVTAEPYWAVTQPSDAVVLENIVRKDTTGTMEQVNAKYELLQRGDYTANIAPESLQALTSDANVPLQLREARAAIAIAKATGADRYAADTMRTALVDLQNAEGYARNKTNMGKPLETVAREATQMAEDARIISIRKMRAEEEAARLAAEQKRLADAQLHAQDEAAKRAQAEQQQHAAEQAKLQADQAAEQAKLQADQARLQAQKSQQDAEAAAAQARLQAQKSQQDAEAAAAQAAKERAEAEAARKAALEQQQQAQAAAAQANQQAQEARQKLLTQLNMILATRDTARGLIMNMSDVLFDFNKSTLKPGAREKLARLSGIVLAYPGLKLQVEGHTDSVGSDEYNQKLSERRADAVRDYLTQQGVNGNNVTAAGMGKANPVASNDTAAGRQQNRRVEIVVSGDVIGTPINETPLTQQQNANPAPPVNAAPTTPGAAVVTPAQQ